ncbi:MAG: CPBP family intramembrane metalloprotease [Verrucomicrobiota bacterium]|nr:CPBP family intramembrane metalloprotease [Verrucomicrobiota bacterium]
MKDTAKLFAWFLAVLVLAGLATPPIYQWAHASVPALAKYGFDNFLHRILLICALILAWPLARSLRLRSRANLHLDHNRRALRDVALGFFFAVIPLVITAAILLATHAFVFRAPPPWSKLGTLLLTAAAVSLLEEVLFRGVILAIFLRHFRNVTAAILTSFIFAAVHFLKTPDRADLVVTWASGLRELAAAFAQFADPILLLAAFATLFMVGLILADARIRTRSLWLSIGLHGGWILASGAFSKFTQRTVVMMPWMGGNLLVGIIALAVGLLTWLGLVWWLRHAERAV